MNPENMNQIGDKATDFAREIVGDLNDYLPSVQKMADIMVDQSNLPVCKETIEFCFKIMVRTGFVAGGLFMAGMELDEVQKAIQQTAIEGLAQMKIPPHESV